MKPPEFQLHIVVELNRDIANSFADQGVIWDKNIFMQLYWHSFYITRQKIFERKREHHTL